MNAGHLRKSAQTAAGADFASPVLARRVQSYISKEVSSGTRGYDRRRDAGKPFDMNAGRTEIPMNPLLALNECGQFVWLDHISRRLITGGGLQRLIDKDRSRRCHEQPDYLRQGDRRQRRLRRRAAPSAGCRRPPDNRALAERLIVEDIQLAADVLRPVYDDSDGANGFVSLEVWPGSAHDTGATIAEARHLWRLVSRPNVMIKVPATVEGIRAVEALTADGINVNITLMFSLEHYEAVAQAYLRGIDRHPDPRRVVSVASVFVSRLDRGRGSAARGDRFAGGAGSPGNDRYRECQTRLPSLP